MFTKLYNIIYSTVFTASQKKKYFTCRSEYWSKWENVDRHISQGSLEKGMLSEQSWSYTNCWISKPVLYGVHTFTLTPAALLHFSYLCTCYAFQCGVVVILPALGVGRCSLVFNGSRHNGEFSWFLQADIFKWTLPIPSTFCINLKL
jgi:hypothetical protein